MTFISWLIEHTLDSSTNCCVTWASAVWSIMLINISFASLKMGSTLLSICNRSSVLGSSYSGIATSILFSISSVHGLSASPYGSPMECKTFLGSAPIIGVCTSMQASNTASTKSYIFSLMVSSFAHSLRSPIVCSIPHLWFLAC